MIYDYIMRDLTLNENKKEKKILELLVKGKTCEQIGEEVGYSSRTIVRRRKALYGQDHQRYQYRHDLLHLRNRYQRRPGCSERHAREV